MSAMSEQETLDTGYHEDFGLVNLHLQVNIIYLSHCIYREEGDIGLHKNL